MNAYTTDRLDLRCCDCMEMMRGMGDNSVDSIVTDPPYGLSKEPDVAEVMRHWLAGEDYIHKGSGFMGKTWDSFVPGPTIWREAYRVLKPGGHLLAFAGTRTQDLMGMAIRLAGFENRDCIMWVFGSGFPKSANVSKMIDKQAGAERKSEYVPNGKNNTHGKGWEGGEHNALSDPPATEAAKQWDGWGTALKPAYEPCLMFRKPLAKGNTVAANVLQHGTGAINVDGCRVGTEHRINDGMSSLGVMHDDNWQPRQVSSAVVGRWPANLIHDGSDEVVGLFPVTTSGGGDRNGAQKGDVFHGVGDTGTPRPFVANSGSAARFFYCAKCSKADRNEGCEGMEAKATAFGNQAQAEMKRGNMEHADGKSGMNKVQMRQNTHPTVKPTDLMRYLCRLVTPPGGLILDPFMGSGSTGKAAMLEGFRFIGSDLSPEYFEIAKARCTAAVERVKRETAKKGIDL